MMGTVVLDINNDGNLDIVSVGNMYGADREIVKYDAGKGLVMLGDGAAGFTAVPAPESGFGIDADTRSIVVTGSVPDGTRQLAVFSNQGPAYLYALPGKGQLRTGSAKGGTLVLANGKTRKYECNYGGGYLSDQPRWIFTTDIIRSVSAVSSTPTTGPR